MYEEARTVCDRCDRDIGEFVNRDGNDLCTYCVKELDKGDEW